MGAKKEAAKRDKINGRGAAALVSAWDLFLKSNPPADPAVRVEWDRIGRAAEDVRVMYFPKEVKV